MSTSGSVSSSPSSASGSAGTPSTSKAGAPPSIYRSNYHPLCTIAGSDPTGGAGIQGDLRTFAAHGAHGSAVITAVTAQGPGGVAAVRAESPDLVAAQIDAVMTHIRPRAIKIGMLGSLEVVAAVAEALDRHEHVFTVLDPVMTAGAGVALLAEVAISGLRAQLAGHVDLLTPNHPEALQMLGNDGATPAADMARSLQEAGWRAVLLKGGHATGAQSLDHLVAAGETRAFARPRLSGATVHGTGCALSSAIAARVAGGESLVDAVEGAKDYVHRLIAAAHEAGSWLLPHLSVEPRPLSPSGPQE